jgi:UDP-N-acetylglucosamine enolpyruvyl transferase
MFGMCPRLYSAPKANREFQRRAILANEHRRRNAEEHRRFARQIIAASAVTAVSIAPEFAGRSARSNSRRNRASRSVLFAALAAEVVYLVYRYSEITRGAMIATEIVDKLLALPAAVTRMAEMIGNSA